MRARPLPPTGRPKSAPGLLGVWRGTVAGVNPLSVFVPSLTGTETPIVDCESADFGGAPLAVDDPVWVLPLEGRRDVVVVIARRAATAPPA